MTILMTGGTGFIGSHTVVELLNAGLCPVVIADNLCNSKIEVIDRIQKIIESNGLLSIRSTCWTAPRLKRSLRKTVWTP